MQCFNACTKENAGIFSQPQGWLILAESKLGHGDRAYKYWKEASPASYNDKAELRVLEPYVFGQFVEGKDSPFAGRAHVHWLTGTASTVMVGTTEGILGLNPETKGLVIDPSIPSEWKEYTMDKTFRGKKLHLQDYDALWKQYLATEHEDDCALRLAFFRLRYPTQLSDPARERYLSYLRRNAAAALSLTLRLEDTAGLRLLLEESLGDSGALSSALDAARAMGYTEAVALLLEQRQRRFGAGRRRSFEL